MGRGSAAATLLAFILGLVGVHLVAFGTFGSDLGAYSDEPAHYVTGLMVRDYPLLAAGESPLRFAEAFYAHFPKVALGNWPPGFYVLVWPLTLVAGDSPRQVLVYVALLAACAGTALTWLVARHTTPAAGVATGVVWLSRPLTLALSGAIMTEVPLALATVATLWAWEVLVRRPRWLLSLILGAVMGFAILIKSSALALLVVPLLPGPLPVPLRLGSLGLALVIAGPWTYAFRAQARAGWLFDLPTWEYTSRAVPFYLAALAASMGWSGGGGVLLWLVSAYRRRSPGDMLERACAAIATAWTTLMFVVPAGYESRHLLPVTVPLHVLGGVGVARAMQWSPAAVITVPAVFGLLLTAELMLGTMPFRHITGYRTAVTSVAEDCPPRCVLLVVSDPEGEGAVVAEAAALRRSAPLTVVRGSKVLSRSDWAGRGFGPVVTSPDEARALVSRLGVTYVFVDRAPRRVADLAAGVLVTATTGAALTATVPIVRRVQHPGRALDETGLLQIWRLSDRFQ